MLSYVLRNMLCRGVASGKAGSGCGCPHVENSNDVATQHSLKCEAVQSCSYHRQHDFFFHIERICACDSVHFFDTSGACILVIEKEKCVDFSSIKSQQKGIWYTYIKISKLCIDP